MSRIQMKSTSTTLKLATRPAHEDPKQKVAGVLSISACAAFAAAGIALLLPLIMGHTAKSQGLIISPDGHPAEVILEDHRVDARLEENVAVVSIEHVFRNPGTSAIEGSFLFPLPSGAQISRFAMDVDGREMSGELLSSEDARRIYEDIVRRSLDPALLEMVGNRSFRASVFPIPPGETRTIRLRYDSVLPKEGSLVTFQYPLQGSLQTNPTIRSIPISRGFEGIEPQLEDTRGPLTGSASIPDGKATSDVAMTSLHLEMSSHTPLATIYSPSHALETERPGTGRAIVRHETPIEDDRDFIVYFGLQDEDVGATLLTHRPYRDRPGYFMLLLSPGAGDDGVRTQAKDIVFVLDTSASMAGEKIEQAREALRYCLNRLDDSDRFGLIAFSSDVDHFRSELVPAQSRGDALYFLDRLEARGGTNIHGALLDATEMLASSETGMIIFLTDGLPSVGVQDEGEIRRAVQTSIPENARLFSFGVGYDVNTQLLDGLSRDTGAPADYISPDENIEERVSAFYNRISHPLLVDLDYELDGVEGYAFAPGELHDLYRGGQLIVTGRYRDSGRAHLELTGTKDGALQSFRYPLDFPEVERDREFVARLWATRRVGQLLEQIRLNGENEELKDEIVALAKEFGLVTPYTSYLVQEEETLALDASLQIPAGSARRSFESAANSADLMVAGTDAFKSREVSGAGAVAASRAIRAMSAAETVTTALRPRVKSVNGRTMFLKDCWVDVEFDVGKPTVEVKMGSDAYFELLRLYPDVIDIARLGDCVTFGLGKTFVRIGAAGMESAYPSEIRSLIE